MKKVFFYVWEYLNQDVHVHPKLNFIPNVIMNLLLLIFAISAIAAVLKYIITSLIN